MAEKTGVLSSPAAMNEYLTVREEQRIKPKLTELKKLRDLSIETATTSIAIMLPVILAGAAAAKYLNQSALGVAGAAVTAIPIATKGAHEAQKFSSGNFAA